MLRGFDLLNILTVLTFQIIVKRSQLHLWNLHVYFLENAPRERFQSLSRWNMINDDSLMGAPDRAENPRLIMLDLWFDLKPDILPLTSLVNALSISGLINSHFLCFLKI